MLILFSIITKAQQLSVHVDILQLMEVDYRYSSHASNKGYIYLI